MNPECTLREVVLVVDYDRLVFSSCLGTCSVFFFIQIDDFVGRFHLSFLIYLLINKTCIIRWIFVSFLT